jgi:hypothetical protein
LGQKNRRAKIRHEVFREVQIKNLLTQNKGMDEAIRIKIWQKETHRMIKKNIFNQLLEDRKSGYFIH